MHPLEKHIILQKLLNILIVYKYNNLKNRKAIEQSTTLGLARKGSKNYRIMMTDSGATFSFYEKSIGEIKSENKTKDIRFWSPTKVLVIDTVHLFDQFTNKYGSLKIDSRDYAHNQIIINWDKVVRDYRGFYLDQTNDLERE